MKLVIFIFLFLLALPAAAHADAGAAIKSGGFALLFHVVANAYILQKIWRHQTEARRWQIGWSLVSALGFVVGPICFLGLHEMPGLQEKELRYSANTSGSDVLSFSMGIGGVGAEGIPPIARMINGELEPGEEAPHSKLAAEARVQARTGDPKAQHHYATLLEFGDGTTQDYKSAARWHRRAADQGYAPAQESLAELYHHGHGVEKSMDEALFWMSLAAIGDRHHEARRDELSSQMTNEAVLAVSARVQVWRPVAHVPERPLETA